MNASSQTGSGRRPGRLTERVRSVATSVWLFVILVWPAVILIGVAVLLPREPAELVEPIEPVWADPVTTAIDSRSPVEILLSDVVVDQLVSPGWNDVVARVDIEVGEVIASNTVVAFVGRLPVVAVNTPEPFTRDLVRRDRGPDVEMLQQFLSQHGVFSADDVDGVFGATTGKAVKAWRESLGDPLADQTFLRHQVLWLAASDFTVASVEIVPGRAAPAANVPVIIGRETFTTGRLVDPQTTRQSLIDGEVSLLIADRIDLGPVTDPTLTAEQLDELSKLIADGTVSVTSPASGPSSTGQAPTEIRIPAELVAINPRPVVAVPGSAVFNGGEGQACVAIDRDGTVQTITVSVVGGDLGVVYLDPSSAPSSPVLVNPTDTFPDLACSD